MNTDEQPLSLEALSAAVGIPVRTIRYYISIGLVQGPTARGLAASYDEEHLLRLRLIRRLTQQHLPLKEIIARLDGLGLDDIRAILAEEARREEAIGQEGAHQSPSAYIASLLEQAHQSTHRSPLGGSGARPAPSAGPAPRTPSVPHVPPQEWSRHELADGLELHVRSDAARRYRDFVEGVIQQARSLGKS